MKWGASLGVFLFSFLSIQSFASSVCSSANFWKEFDASYMQDLADTDSTHQLNFENLKLVVWNVYKEDKVGAFADIDLLTQNIDLAFFQEAYLNQPFANIICSRDQLNWKMAKSFADKHGIYSGVMTAGHQNPEQSYALISPDTEPFSDIHKVMLVNLYEIPGRAEKLMVINLHGINFVMQDAYERQIQVIRETIRTHHGPVILAGDFNSYTSGRTEFLLNAMKSVGMTHAKIEGNEYQGLVVLDHLFYRGFEVTKAEVLKNIETSDHKPLYFELRLKNL